MTPSPTCSTTAAPFVPEQERKPLGAEDAVLRGEIGVADAAGEDAHQRFARSRRVDRELFDHSGLTRFAGDDAAGDDRLVASEFRRFRHGDAPYLEISDHGAIDPQFGRADSTPSRNRYISSGAAHPATRPSWPTLL